MCCYPFESPKISIKLIHAILKGDSKLLHATLLKASKEGSKLLYATLLKASKEDSNLLHTIPFESLKEGRKLLHGTLLKATRRAVNYTLRYLERRQLYR